MQDILKTLGREGKAGRVKYLGVYKGTRREEKGRRIMRDGECGSAKGLQDVHKRSEPERD